MEHVNESQGRGKGQRSFLFCKAEPNIVARICKAELHIALEHFLSSRRLLITRSDLTLSKGRYTYHEASHLLAPRDDLYRRPLSQALHSIWKTVEGWVESQRIDIRDHLINKDLEFEMHATHLVSEDLMDVLGTPEYVRSFTELLETIAITVTNSWGTSNSYIQEWSNALPAWMRQRLPKNVTGVNLQPPASPLGVWFQKEKAWSTEELEEAVRLWNKSQSLGGHYRQREEDLRLKDLCRLCKTSPPKSPTTTGTSSDEIAEARKWLDKAQSYEVTKANIFAMTGRIVDRNTLNAHKGGAVELRRTIARLKREGNTEELARISAERQKNNKTKRWTAEEQAEAISGRVVTKMSLQGRAPARNQKSKASSLVSNAKATAIRRQKTAKIAEIEKAEKAAKAAKTTTSTHIQDAAAVFVQPLGVSGAARAATPVQLVFFIQELNQEDGYTPIPYAQLEACNGGRASRYRLGYIKYIDFKDYRKV
ncbi:hypothetical protein EG329_003555 [Mollisiaceae sp. DMI_Dod_QoI]|nr:hypothetical protein EG329_003555 [Helotiales sp. DMI_Dod_QoI]